VGYNNIVEAKSPSGMISKEAKMMGPVYGKRNMQIKKMA
jgi:hypothetical protein